MDLMDWIKKIFNFLSALPAFTALFSRAQKTGKIDPVEALDALSSVSPSTKKCADVAMDTLNRGGGLPEVANSLKNVGKIEVLGQTLDTRTLTEDLKKAGGICSAIGNLLEGMQNKSPQDIVDFGNAATDVSNWRDMMNRAKG